MPKLNEAFPSKYMTAADFENGDVTATILSADVETVGQGADASQKIILKLKGIQKPVVINRTNANTIAKVTGSDDTDDWIGKRITLGASEVEFKGELVMSIRVRLKKPTSAQAPVGKTIVENPDADETNPSADDF